MPPSGNSWEEWRIYILKELDRLSENDDKTIAGLAVIVRDVATLQTKAGIWGAVGAAIPVCIFLLMEFLRNRG